MLGGILWFVVGRVRASALPTRSAPDDDIEFLGRIGTMSDQDERIRRLEEELAQLDAEDDDPKWQTRTERPEDSRDSHRNRRPADPPVRGAAPDADDDGRGQRGAVG